jgi:zinc-ribbon domain
MWVQRGLMPAATTSCPSCSADLPATARFCSECGARVAPRAGPVSWEVAETRYFGVLPGRRFFRALVVRLNRLWAVTLGRMRLTREASLAYVASERELLRLRRDQARLATERGRAVYELGEAVSRGQDREAEQARGRVDELNARLSEMEDEMSRIEDRRLDRLEHAHLEGGATVIEPLEKASRR